MSVLPSARAIVPRPKKSLGYCDSESCDAAGAAGDAGAADDEGAADACADGDGDSVLQRAGARAIEVLREAHERAASRAREGRAKPRSRVAGEPAARQEQRAEIEHAEEKDRARDQLVG